MLTRHGWRRRPSPRPGFTFVEASRETTEAPVIAVVHDSLQAVRLFRYATDEAMSRSLSLLVLDYGTTSLRDELGGPSVDARERSSLRSLLANPHVTVIRVDPADSNLERSIDYIESVKASLLILGADHIGAAAMDSRLSNRIFNGDFDVLVVTDHPSENQQETGTASSV